MAPSTCHVYWGSHGCDLPSDHEQNVHQCGVGSDLHCEFEVTDPVPGDATGEIEVAGRRRDSVMNPETWSWEWSDWTDAVGTIMSAVR